MALHLQYVFNELSNFGIWNHSFFDIMAWILISAVLFILVVITVIFLMMKKNKPVIELDIDEGRLGHLNLKAGDFLTMIPNTDTKEVAVYLSPEEPGNILGFINNGFIYRNVTKGNIEAKIDSIIKGKIILEIVRV